MSNQNRQCTHAPKILFLGAGAQALDLVEMLEASRQLDIFGFLDMNYPKKTHFHRYPILGDESLLPECKQQGIDNLVITYGWVRAIAKRIATIQMATRLGFTFPRLIHPTAVIHPSAKLGPGVLVLANTVIGSEAQLGQGVVVNNNAVVSHGSKIGDFSMIAPGAMIASNVVIGEQCIIGMNASIFYEVTVAPGKVICNGQTIFKNV